VAAFNNDIFSYSVTLNASLVNVGALTVLSGTTASNCPAGRTLRETGKKLYPDANPGVSTLMVSVFDPISCLTGFIDPNSPLFAVFSTDRPNYMISAVDPGPGALKDAGPPVYTNSSVTAGTSIVAGTSIQSGTGVLTLVGQNRVSNIPLYSAVTANPNSNVYVNVSVAQVQKISLTGAASPAGVSIHATSNGLVGGTDLSALGGSLVYLIITNANAGGGANISVTFGNQIREASGGSNVLAPASTYTFTFACDGVSLFEVARSTATNAGPVTAG
jgi:hypothetical protein